MITLKNFCVYDTIVVLFKQKYINTAERKTIIMLETRELFKKYRPKKGKEVIAVDRISLRWWAAKAAN